MNSTASTAPSILVVDDSPQNLQIVGETLGRQLECELSFATNGQMALDSIAERKPDLILLDVVMPSLSGIQVCQQLKSDLATAGIPVVFLTAKADPDDIVAGFEAGGADYVTKPFNQAELLARVSTQLQLKKASDQIAGKNEDLRHLLQVLCHDLANPIASISGLLEICATDPTVLSELLPEMNAIAHQALNQIKLVREMHSMEQEHYHLNVLPFPLIEAMHAAEKNLAQKYREKDLHLTYSIPSDLEVQVEPISFINTVLANLLSNAAKFSFRGGKVDVQARLMENHRVVLEVRDQGIGISPFKLPELFVPRSNASTPGTEGETGTGFGMPLVKSFTEAYGGQILVTSRDKNQHPQDHGTTISLILRKV